MPGSGKSSVGVVLAKAMGLGFVDGDLLIQQKQGALLQEILDQRGVEGFLDLEEQVLSALDCRRMVIAPGGSCVCRVGTMEHLRRLGTVVYLSLSLAEVGRRIQNLDSRGIAMERGQTLAEVYAARLPLYQRFAHVTVAVDGQSVAETVAAVRRAVADHTMNF